MSTKDVKNKRTSAKIMKIHFFTNRIKRKLAHLNRNIKQKACKIVKKNKVIGIPPNIN